MGLRMIALVTVALSPPAQRYVVLSPLTLSQHRDSKWGLSPTAQRYMVLSPLTLSQYRDNKWGLSPTAQRYMVLSPLTLSQHRDDKCRPQDESTGDSGAKSSSTKVHGSLMHGCMMCTECAPKCQQFRVASAM